MDPVPCPGDPGSAHILGMAHGRIIHRERQKLGHPGRVGRSLWAHGGDQQRVDFYCSDRPLTLCASVLFVITLCRRRKRATTHAQTTVGCTRPLRFESSTTGHPARVLRLLCADSCPSVYASRLRAYKGRGKPAKNNSSTPSGSGPQGVASWLVVVDAPPRPEASQRCFWASGWPPVPDGGASNTAIRPSTPTTPLNAVGARRVPAGATLAWRPVALCRFHLLPRH